MLGHDMHLFSRLRCISSCFTALAFCCSTYAADISTKAKFAYIIDKATGTVLLEKNANELMAPASMAKLVTAAVVFDEIKAGRLSLDDEFIVSDEAHQKGGPASGGSTMFLRPGSSVRVEDLLKGAVVQSGNDASLALAEGIAGSEAGFARMMNKLAKNIGMVNSTFKTATGLPHPEQKVSAKDLALIADYIISEHANFLPLYSLESFEWEGVNQSNRNPLLDEDIGADGMKTGFTEESGYGIVATANKDGLRRILVINGLESSKERGQEAYRLLNWSYRAFEQQQILPASHMLGRLRIYGGEKFSLEVGTRKALKTLMLKGGEFDSRYRAEVTYSAPLKAPIIAGDVVGAVKLKNLDGDIVSTADVIALEDIAKGPLHRRALDSILSVAGLI